VPWISLRFLSYEVRLATGDWIFGGVEHTRSKLVTAEFDFEGYALG